MPITISHPIIALDQASFHQVDTKVTGIAFGIHNEFGRYLQERLYQAELFDRASRQFDVVRELKITASLDDFSKDYFADFLVNSGVLLETKVVRALTPSHTAQILNYLFLTGLHFATLLNFQTERVQHRFVSTQLTPAKRKRVHYHKENWQPFSSRCRMLESILIRMIDEWGAFLDTVLYREALMHFLGGESRVVRKIAIYSDRYKLGTQSTHLLEDDIAFAVTAAVHSPHSVREHLYRFLSHTQLKAIQWINMNRHDITLQTITVGSHALVPAMRTESTK